MKKTNLSLKALFVLVFLTLSTLTTFAQSPDYNGNWKLSKKQPLSGIDYANSIPNQVNVQQTGNSISIKRTTEVPGRADQVASQTLTLDGKPNVVNAAADTKRTATIQWSNDQKSFTEHSICTDPSKNDQLKYQITETWSLSADGHTLTILKSFENPNNAEDKWSVKGEYTKE